MDMSRGNKRSLIAFPGSLRGRRFCVQLYYPAGAALKSQIACFGNKPHSLILSFEYQPWVRARSWVLPSPGAMGRAEIHSASCTAATSERLGEEHRFQDCASEVMQLDTIRCDAIWCDAMRCDVMRCEDINTLSSIRSSTRAPPGIIWR